MSIPTFKSMSNNDTNAIARSLIYKKMQKIMIHMIDSGVKIQHIDVILVDGQISIYDTNTNSNLLHVIHETPKWNFESVRELMINIMDDIS